MKRLLVLFIIFPLIFIACNKKESVKEISHKPNLSTKAGDYIIPIVDPDHMRIPFPNDLLIDQTTGKVNIPVLSTDSQAVTLAKWQLNTLDGFSTSTTIYVEFTYPIAVSTVTPKDVLILNMKKLKAALGGSPITDAIVPFSSKFESMGGKNRLILTPGVVLDPATQYVVILKKGIKGINRVDVSPSPFYLFLKNDKPLYDTATSSSTVPALSDDEAYQLEQVREQLQDLFLGLDRTGLAKKDDILMVWSFTTLTVGNVLNKIISDIQKDVSSTVHENPLVDYVAHFDDYPDLGTSVAPAICVYAPSVTPTVCGDTPENPTLRNIYDAVKSLNYSFPISWVIEGSFYTRNYRAMLGYFSEDLTWLPEKIHFILTLPPGQGPFPVVIYQHGITRNKKDIFAVAPDFALAGFATIAIDLPDHGELREGNVDLNEDGTTDGDRFVDPENLLTTRDRMKQAVINLVMLSKVIENWSKINAYFKLNGNLLPINDFDGSPSPSTDGFAIGPDSEPDLPAVNSNTGLDEVYFVGHSLGAIIGGVFMAVSPDVDVGVLNSGGGEVAHIISDSPELGPVFKRMLAGVMGYELSSPEFAQFWYDFVSSAQWLVDSADPINYARYWNQEPLYTFNKSPEIKKVLIVGSRFDPVVPDWWRDKLAETGGLITDYSDLLTKSVLPPSAPLSSGGYVILNSYTSYPTSASYPSSMANYVTQDSSGNYYLNIGSHSLILTPARVNEDFSVAGCTLSDQTGCIAFLPYYLEMYNEMNSFLSTNGNYIKVGEKGDYLPPQTRCNGIFQAGYCDPSDPRYPYYATACYLCSFWTEDLVFTGK